MRFLATAMIVQLFILMSIILLHPRGPSTLSQEMKNFTTGLALSMLATACAMALLLVWSI